MDNITELLTALSEKLGTTTEYLWSVLISQAGISATQSLIFVILHAVIGVVIYKEHKKLLAINGYKDDWDESPAVFVMLVVFLSWLLASLYSVFGAIPNIIAGYFNPEYWALQEILNKI